MFCLSEPCELLFLRFFFLFDLSCGESNVISVYVLCCSVNRSASFVCYVSDSVCELLGETLRNMFRCGCYFVVECYGVVQCGWRCSIGYTMYGHP